MKKSISKLTICALVLAGFSVNSMLSFMAHAGKVKDEIVRDAKSDSARDVKKNEEDKKKKDIHMDRYPNQVKKEVREEESSSRKEFGPRSRAERN